MCGMLLILKQQAQEISTHMVGFVSALQKKKKKLAIYVQVQACLKHPVKNESCSITADKQLPAGYVPLAKRKVSKFF